MLFPSDMVQEQVTLMDAPSGSSTPRRASLNQEDRYRGQYLGADEGTMSTDNPPWQEGQGASGTHHPCHHPVALTNYTITTFLWNWNMRALAKAHVGEPWVKVARVG